jgi:hypothetical protein
MVFALETMAFVPQETMTSASQSVACAREEQQG